MANPLAQTVLSAVDKTQTAFNSVNKNLKQMEDRATGINNIFARFLPLLGASTIVGFAKNLINTADYFDDLSQRTGIAQGRLVAWNEAVLLSGASQESFATALARGSRVLVDNSEKLEKLGITARTSEELIFQLSDVISSLDPDDPQRVAIAMDILGKSAAELVPLLAQGGDNLRAMVARGSELAAGMEELAPLAGEFNDELDLMANRVKLLSAQGLVPILRDLNEFTRSINNAESTSERFAIRLGHIARNLSVLGYIASSPAGQLWLSFMGESEEKAEGTADAAAELTSEMERLQRQLRVVNLQLEEQQKNLAKSRRSLQVDAYKQNIDALKAQVQEFNNLGSAMQSAFQTAGNAAAEASQKAQELLARASATRLAAQERISDLNLRDADPDEADAIRNRQIIEALDKAKSARLQADYQRLQGNTKEAEQQLEIAEQQAQRADDLTNKLNDESLIRARVLESAEELARIDEVRAGVQKKLAEEELARQEALRDQIQQNEERVADYTERLTQLTAQIKELAESETAIKIRLDEEALEKTRQQIADLQNRIANLNYQNFTGVYDSQGNAVFREPPGFKDGGVIPGSSPSWRADDKLIRATSGEGVVNIPAMRYYGGAAWLNAINKRLLPRFADGGVVGRVSVPELPASLDGNGLHRGTFVLPGGETIEVHAEASVFDRLATASLQYRKRR
jgi:hypothetical protein